MKLEELKSASSSLISKLQEIGINSVEHLIVKGFRDVKTLLPEISEHELEELIIEANRKKGFWFITGTEFAELEKTRIFFSTGSKALDQILGGGVWSWNVAEFYGEMGIGKCLSPDTKVLTPYGSRELQKITVGDYVYGVRDGKLVVAKVLGKYLSFKTKMLIVKTDNHVLKCSEDHRILTCTGWKKAKDLKVGENVICIGLQHASNLASLDERRNTVSQRELSSLHCDGAFPKAWEDTQSNTYESYDARAKEGRESIPRQTLENGATTGLFNISRWAYRRRGNYSVRTRPINCEVEDPTGIYPSPLPPNYKHLQRAYGKAIPLLLRTPYYKRQEVPNRLFSKDIWIESCMATGENKRTPYCKKGTCRADDSMGEVALVQTGLCTILQGGTSSLLEVEEAKYDLETVREIYEVDGEFALQDITTTSGNYIANGILVHNSQILYTIAVEAANKGVNVIYIDSEGTCREKRMLEIAEKRGYNPSEIGKHITFIRSMDTDILFEVINRLPVTIEAKDLKLICVDSFITPFRAEYLGREMLAPRQQAIGKAAHKLRVMAQVYNIAVAITNQVVAVPTQMPTHGGFEYKPTGGFVLGHICLAPDTLVYADSGILHIKDIHNPLLLPAMNEEFGMCMDKAQVKCTDALEINHELVCTPDHVVFKYDNGKIIECEARSLRKGDWLVIPAKVSIKGKRITLPRIEPDLVYRVLNGNYVKKKLQEKGFVLKRKEHTSRLGISPRHLRKILNEGYATHKTVIKAIEDVLREKINTVIANTGKHRLIQIPEVLTSDLAQIFGYWLGDGDSSLYNNTIALKDERLNVLATYGSLIAKVFGLRPRISKIKGKNCYELKVTHKAAAELFKWLKPNTHVISKAEEEVIQAFLKGLFDAEGYANHKEVVIALKDKGLLMFVKMLLLRLGIISSISTMGENAFRLSIYGEDIDQFKKLIGFTDEQKNAKIKQTTRNSKYHHTIKRLSETVAIKKVNNIRRIKVHQGFVDITVEPTRNFIANGYFVHNSEPRVWIRRAEGTKRVARIVDSSWLPEAEITFRVTEAGVVDV